MRYRGWLGCCLPTFHLPATHPQDDQIIESGQIHVAPTDRHMLLEQGHIRLSHSPHENHTRPDIDPLFRCAAISCGPAVVGVALTRQLDDGTAGLLAVKDRGGTAVAKNPRKQPQRRCRAAPSHTPMLITAAH